MKYFHLKEPFILESGAVLPEIQIAYTTIGNRNADDSNVIWVCHALTANSDAADWWKGLIGGNGFFNPEEHFIICANILGSCYGTTGPLSVNPLSWKPYHHSFPLITVRDIVKANELLREHLGIEKINTLIGGSLGGQQILEWVIQKPELADQLVLIATNAQSSPWGIAFRESQRLAIQADSTWIENRDDAAQAGLKAARSIGLLSYRNYNTYKIFQQEESNDKTDGFKAAKYQQYQGEKLVQRFNAFSYYLLTKAMDSHNVGRGRASVQAALQKIQSRAIVIGISSDLLFPIEEQKFLVDSIPDASYFEIDSPYGHDGFLVEVEQITGILKKNLTVNKINAKTKTITINS